MRIDETLMQPRRVVRWLPDDDGLSFSVDLSCGHSVWTSLQPPIEMYCGLCLQTLVNQIREIQKQQRVDE